MTTNAIIFDYNEFQSCEMSPYSEKFLNAVYPKYKLAILSKKTFKKGFDYIEMKTLQNNGNEKFFKIILLNKTPKNGHYLQCSEKIHNNPKETIFIGQNFDDVKIASEYGFKTYLTQNINSADDFSNEQIKKIKSIDEFLKILQNEN